MEITFPRSILPEILTHRQFSRNSASSRAIPVEYMIESVKTNPYIPVFTGAKKGMSGVDKSNDPEFQLEATKIWLSSASHAVYLADRLKTIGCHKQDINRILEPYLWHTMIISSTTWSNFFAQRCDPNAHPGIQTIACIMSNELEASVPDRLEYDQWHLPYVDIVSNIEDCKKVSVARCARVSYLRQMSTDFDADISLYNKLLTNMHMSPFEHVATPLQEKVISNSNFEGWLQYRKTILNECR
jgi:thymidylate synthase ThyX